MPRLISPSTTAAASIVDRVLAPQVIGRDAMDIEAAYVAMVHAVRNIGLQGASSSVARAARGSQSYRSDTR